MKLYFSRGACSMGPRIIINELNLQCEYESVDLQTKKTETGNDFFKINPKGSVPTLELDNKEVLTEAAVILQYLAFVGKSSTLLPPESDFTRFRVLEALNFVATEMHKGVGVLFNQKLTEETKNDVYRPLIKTKLALINNKLGKTKYFVDDTFTLPDAYLFVILTWVNHFKFDLNKYPNVKRYFDDLQKRPSIQQTLQQEGFILTKA